MKILSTVMIYSIYFKEKRKKRESLLHYRTKYAFTRYRAIDCVNIELDSI